MSTPKRIQRKRTKGWRMPEGAVYVGRPSRWGNPFSVVGAAGGSVVGPPWFDVKGWQLGPGIRHVDDHQLALYASHGQLGAAVEHSVALFRDLVAVRLRDRASEAHTWLRPLAGVDLACWCPLDQPCHADVLLELANGGA